MPKYKKCHCHKCLHRRALRDLINNKYEYRQLDGTKNHKDNKGKAHSRLRRIGPCNYEDGVSKMIDGPNPRDISNTLFNQKHSKPNSKKASAFLWLWGQFIDHTIGITEPGNTEAHNIHVPKGDTYFDPNNEGDKVIPFHRSVYDESTGTSTGNPRQHINELSSFLDASLVYGNDSKRNSFIRKYYKGRLKTGIGGTLPCTDGKHANAGNAATSICLAGDIRANENLGLTSLHTIFVREHNYWADQIYNKCPQLSDEDIYQKAKIMVEAEIQAITFNEFLPLLLGKTSIPEYTGYDENKDPSIDTEFSTAAFRLGHTLVNGEILRLYECGCEIQEGNLKLRDGFFSTHRIFNEGGIEPVLYGYTKSFSEELDGCVIDELRNFLFGQPGHGGLDLVSLNIQRGRDHGLPYYNNVRTACGLPKIKNFEELTNGNKEISEKLQGIYNNIDHLDLWVGGLLESKYKNSQLGQLFHHLVLNQFLRIRDADRYWYQKRLTHSQIQLIQNTKLSHIIKRNTSYNHWPSDIFTIKTG